MFRFGFGLWSLPPPPPPQASSFPPGERGGGLGDKSNIGSGPKTEDAREGGQVGKFD